MIQGSETSDKAAPDAWLRPGETCWRVERAARVALLHDGADYFTAARAAILQARHSVLLIGWSFDPRACLCPLPDDQPEGETIGGVLRRLKAVRPEVAIRLLIWDMPWPISNGKEMTPDEIRDSLGPGIDYRIDSCLPLGACQHQKVLVVDDRIAFCGGTDFEGDRWDTTAHRDRDPRRRLPNGESYTPRHDVMLCVDGMAAAALGELARERWHAATGETLPPRNREVGESWPDGLAPAFRDIAVGIARTLPAIEDAPGVRESEALYLAAIAGARRVIYLENQYFASTLIAEALIARLAEPDGPEVVVIVAEESPNTFDRLTMDSARRTVMEMLRSADPHRRLRILAPRTEKGTAIMVHSKVAVFDDRLARIGSSNLNNRSFGYDSECDLAIEILPDGEGADTPISSCIGGGGGEVDGRGGPSLQSEAPPTPPHFARSPSPGGRREGSAADRAAVTSVLESLLASHAAIRPARLQEAVREKGSYRAVLDDPEIVSPARLCPLVASPQGPVAWLVDALRLGDPVGTEDAWQPWLRAEAMRKARDEPSDDEPPSTS